MLLHTARQSSSVWSRGLPSYWSVSTPSTLTYTYPHYRLYSISRQRADISTSLHWRLLFITLLHLYVCLCLKSWLTEFTSRIDHTAVAFPSPPARWLTFTSSIDTWNSPSVLPKFLSIPGNSTLGIPPTSKCVVITPIRSPSLLPQHLPP